MSYLMLETELDRWGRRLYPHPLGEQYPFVCGHNPTGCRLELPHRGRCWPETRSIYTGEVLERAEVPS